MQPICQLNNVEEFKHKHHLSVWVTFPKSRDVQQYIFSEKVLKLNQKTLVNNFLFVKLTPLIII